MHKINVAVLSLSIFILAFSTIAFADDSEDLWTGRFSILTSMNDNDRISDGKSVVQNTMLRFMMEDSVTENQQFQFHILNSFTLTSSDLTGDLSFSTMIPDDLKYRCVDLTWATLDEPVSSIFTEVDRLNMKFALPDADITIGRQAITFGEAWFWNPLDNYLPFDAQTVDRDYKQGVDALRVDIPTGTFSGVNLIAVAGREINPFSQDKSDWFSCDWYGSSVLARYFTSLNGWDYAIQGGKVYGGYQAGAGLTGQIGDYQIRGEFSHISADDNIPLPPDFKSELYTDHFEYVLGVGRLFESGLDVQLEYFFNGASESDNLRVSRLRYFGGASRQMSQQLIGAYSKMDITPLLRAQLTGIYSLTDSSFQVQPGLTYSVSDNADFLFGLVLNFGETQDLTDLSGSSGSEFGSFPNIIYAEYKRYF